MRPAVTTEHGASALLRIAGWLSIGIAALHVAMIFVGASAYRFFDAGEEMARRAEAGSPLPALLTLAVAILFAVFGLYAFSGAGTVRRLPLLRAGLVAIGVVYTLRGFMLVAQLNQLRVSADSSPRHAAFSAVSLTLGLLYLLGTRGRWRWLGERPGR